MRCRFPNLDEWQPLRAPASAPKKSAKKVSDGWSSKRSTSGGLTASQLMQGGGASAGEMLSAASSSSGSLPPYVPPTQPYQPPPSYYTPPGFDTEDFINRRNEIIEGLKQAKAEAEVEHRRLHEKVRLTLAFQNGRR